MTTDPFDFVSLQDLRIGLFVDLDLGWMAHPFPASRFKISTSKQIEILRGLGVARIRYVPAKSDPPPNLNPAATAELTASTAPDTGEAEKRLQALRQQRAAQRLAEQQSLAQCERRFAESAMVYHRTQELLHSSPLQAGAACQSLVQGMAADMLAQGDTAIRLLTEAAGDKVALHPVNVTVVSLLLGRAMGMQGQALEDLGMAAFLHDIGKTALPERVRRLDDNFSAAELRAYQDHVAQGVRLAQSMGLRPDAIAAIAQHHEMADGSGFPQRLKRDAMGLGASILALVNRYDTLCNANKPGAAPTPHEALAMIFAQFKTRFDGVVLSTFIRMMGVYPPGSVVQLNDERHAMVVAVNSARPLKPRVIVHEPGVPRHEALLLDLETTPNASIRRSLKPSSLPSEALDYLQPRTRICYFYEMAANAGTLAASA